MIQTLSGKVDGNPTLKYLHVLEVIDGNYHIITLFYHYHGETGYLYDNYRTYLQEHVNI